jgi:hypothetical protein
MLRHDFFHAVMLQKVDLDVAGVILNVADVIFECCEFPSPLMLRRDFFLLFFFSITVDLTSATTHLTPTVDLTALRTSEGTRSSGRPGASNAEKIMPPVFYLFSTT